MTTSHSTEFTNIIATIAVRAKGYATTWTPEQCVEFAWYSVNQVGDAADDDEDFGRHIRAFEKEMRD